MTNKINFLIGTLFGASVSGGIGYFFYQKKVKKIQEMADEQIKMMEEYYKRIDEYRRVPEEEKIDEDIEDTRQHTAEDKKRLKELSKKAEYTDYTQMYTPEKQEETEPISPELEEAHNIHEERKNDPPKIITSEEASKLPATFDHMIIYYYTYNDVATDENDHVLDNPELLYGDVVDNSSFLDDEEQETLLIINYAHDTLYEIVKVNAEYQEEEDEQ